jgi:HlyD family secretion protein
VLTAPELESAALDFANSQSALVRARPDLDLARQARADATVRAPISGTVLAQPVAVGQVIASAISSVSGGTTLLQMADLSRIRMRALVAETDIGSVRAGQVASVTVDAFPQRPFTASVEKIEPQAVVQQSVTMFPVLISISNQQGLLLPGMNGEVSVLIAERDSVPAVSLDAVRTVRELPAVVSALGMNLDSVRAEVQRQVEAMAREREAAMDDAGRASGGANGNASGGASGASDRESMRGRFAQMRGRGPGGGAPDSARMRRWMARGGGGRGAGGGAGFGAAGGNGGGFAAAGGAAFAGTSAGGRAGRAQVVFVRTAAGLAPRVVRLGVSNYDYAQVLSGVKEGDEVALLSVAEIQAKRQQDQSRLRERMGSGMPGVSATPGGRGGTRGGGGR